MASGVGASLDSTILASVLGNAAGTLVVSPGMFGALYKTAVIGNAKSGGTEWTTSDTTNYARLSFGVGTANWSIAAFVSGTGCVGTNINQVAFGSYISGSASQSIFSVGFNSLLSGAGTLLWFADLGSAQTVTPGIIVQFNAGDASCTLL